MANPVLGGFQSLTRFAGRDRRGQFWPYAAVVILFAFIAMSIGMAVVMNGVFTEMQAFAAAHPEATTIQSGPGSYSISIDGTHPDAPVPDLSGFFVSLGLGVLAMIALLGAAVSRRLHDSGRSARWGLLPVPFLLFGIGLFPVMMRSMMAAGEPNLVPFFLLFINNIVYLIALVSLIVLLALPGTRGPNRFGPETTS